MRYGQDEVSETERDDIEADRHIACVECGVTICIRGTAGCAFCGDAVPPAVLDEEVAEFRCGNCAEITVEVPAWTWETAAERATKGVN